MSTCRMPSTESKPRRDVILEQRGLFTTIHGLSKKQIAVLAKRFEHLTWQDPNDFTNCINPFYADAGAFYAGLTPEVVEHLKHAGFPVRVARPKMLASEHEVRVPPRFAGQQKAVDAILAKRHGVVVAPMGAGKTYIMAAAIARLGGRCLVIGYQTEAVNQIAEEIARFTSITPGVYQGDAPLSVFDDYDVVVAGSSKLQSLRRRLRAWNDIVDTIDYVFIDEAHHAAALGSSKLLHDLANVRGIVGVTATYGRTDSTSRILRFYFGEPIITIPVSEVIDVGAVVPLTFHRITVPPKDYSSPHWKSRDKETYDFHKVNTDYIVRGATGRNDIIARYVKWHTDNGRTVAVIVNRVEHIDELLDVLSRKLDSNVVVCPVADSGGRRFDPVPADQRRSIFASLSAGRVNVVISTVLEEAVNIPGLDAVVIAAGGKSWIKSLQRIRSSRPHEGKTRGYVAYFADQGAYMYRHSQEVHTQMKKYAAQHSDNVMEEWPS